MPKKPAYPTKPCPRCNQPIHAAAKSHSCGWTMNRQATAAKHGRPKGEGITMHDIESVKALVHRIGAEKVRELARVLR